MDIAILIPLLIVFSAFFSGFETAVFSLSPLQRFRLRDSGGLMAFIARLLEKPREFLTTILLGNEVVNVGISILGGHLAYQLLATQSQRVVYIVSTAVTTLVVLIFGEILPKNIAIRSPVLFSQALVIPYQVFAWVVFPFR